MSSVVIAPARRYRGIGRLAVGVVSLVVVIVPSYLTGALAISMGPEIGFTPAGLGLLMGGRFAAAAAVSAVAGRWVERFGAVRAMRLAVLTVAATSLAIASFVRDPITFAALLCLNGVALATVQPAVDSWMARTVSGRRQGLAFGIKQAAVPTAALLAGVAVPVAAAGSGWRAAWLAAGLAALLTAACMPRRAAQPGAGVVHTRRRRNRRSIATMVVLAVCFGLGSVAVVNLTTFLVVSTVAAGFDDATAGAVFAVASATGITARLVVGYCADRIRDELLMVLAAIQAAGAGAFLVLGLVSGAAYVAAAPAAFALGLGWPGLLLLAVVRENQHAPGEATGIINTGSFIGSIVGPAVFGLLATRVGYSAGWLFSASCLLAAAGAALIGRRLLRRRPDRVPG